MGGGVASDCAGCPILEGFIGHVLAPVTGELPGLGRSWSKISSEVSLATNTCTDTAHLLCQRDWI
jgi:hypothetical protein